MLDPLDVEAVVLRFGAATDFALLVEGFGAGSFSSGSEGLLSKKSDDDQDQGVKKDSEAKKWINQL